MEATNRMEELVLTMAQNGEKLHDMARDLAIDMALRQTEEAEKITDIMTGKISGEYAVLETDCRFIFRELVDSFEENTEYSYYLERVEELRVDAIMEEYGVEYEVAKKAMELCGDELEYVFDDWGLLDKYDFDDELEYFTEYGCYSDRIW